MNIPFQTSRRTASISAVMTTLTLLGALGTAQAAVFKDPQLESLQDANKYVDLEQLAQSRLKANAGDAEASAALSLALTFVDPVDAKRLDAGARQAKLCIEQHPLIAACHLAAAQNLGTQMLNMGMAKAMRSVGSLKEAWIRTLELDPNSFTARVELAKLYVTVPGMLGGSVSKARDLEAAVRGSQPETARIIRVHIAADDKKWAEMESELLALKPGKDGAMRGEIRTATMQLAKEYLKDSPAKAKSLYERLQREQPTSASGFYGMSRVVAAQGQTDEALRHLERARTLSDADEYPIEHRLGDAYLAKGDKAQAKAAYTRYLANKRANPANLESARKSLSQLN
ncbi:MAG: tetratricopeptide repeat protein [Burkholderiaceae bacterium]|nr:tetratricopeptide repeat protein [Burkholderiaceae bacterium]